MRVLSPVPLRIAGTKEGAVEMGHARRAQLGRGRVVDTWQKVQIITQR